MPANRQIHFYLYAMKRIRPRPIELGVEIALRGEPTARIVASMIANSRNIKERNDLLLILISMREMEVFDSCSDNSVRHSILPQAYSVEEAPANLRYALGVIDLCLREPGS